MAGTLAGREGEGTQEAPHPMVPAPPREAKGNRDPAGQAEVHGESKDPARDGEGRREEDLSFTSN